MNSVIIYPTHGPPSRLLTIWQTTQTRKLQRGSITALLKPAQPRNLGLSRASETAKSSTDAVGSHFGPNLAYTFNSLE